MASLLPQPSSPAYHHSFLHDPADDSDADTASQRSISLSSPALSPRNSSAFNNSSNPLASSDTASKRVSHPYTLDTDLSSEADDVSMYAHEEEPHDTPSTSAAPSVYEDHHDKVDPLPTYPPSLPHAGDRESIASFASGSSRKTRPESMLLDPHTGPLVLGVALVDFNHVVGPTIEYSNGDIFEDEEVAKILPFLALPDGAHLSAEDYSYFHLVPSGRNPTTIFGISCNQQIAASALLVRDVDVTRSIVQKAVVVLASKPVFGPIRDKLGVVTRALFNQRDFRETDILDDFALALENSLRGQLTESGLYMGTSLRELVHTFRQRTLVLVKALMLQKKIMFYGHPVERLCTYQYSLISLLPGLLQTLDDCGSPPLAARAPTLSRPTSLRTSDHKSMMAYMGLPLDIFGKDAFFQPYLPLQQLDMLKDSQSWLCGSTNSIVTQQKEVDLFVNTETGIFEFRDPKLERSAGLTAADRKWMDDIIKDVNDGWSDDDPSRPQSMQFKGSDDYLRTKFEEYVSAALSSVKYRDFMTKGEGSGVIISGGSGGDATSTEDFNPLWIQEFKKTNAYEVWERTTDPLLFDIVEPRHPCNEKPSVVADIGLRLQEGIQELKLEQQLAPAREAVTRTLTAGSTNFFKAVEGVRGRWTQRSTSSGSGSGSLSGSITEETKSSRASTPIEISKVDLDGHSPESPSPPSGTMKPMLLSKHLSLSSTTPSAPATPAKPAAFSGWGASIGSFVAARASKFASPRVVVKPADTPPDIPPKELTPIVAATDSNPPPPPIKTPEIIVESPVKENSFEDSHTVVNKSDIVETSHIIEDIKPFIEDPHPVPAITTRHPVVEDTHPAVQAAKPVLEATNPAVEVVHPVLAAVHPVFEAAHPVIEETQSVFMAATSVKDASPVVATAHSVEDTHVIEDDDAVESILPVHSEPSHVSSPSDKAEIGSSGTSVHSLVDDLHSEVDSIEYTGMAV